MATVQLPAAGEFSWAVEQGWFGTQELGTLAISASAGAGGGGSSPWTLPLLAVAAALAGLGAADLARQRRPGRGREPLPA